MEGVLVGGAEVAQATTERRSTRRGSDAIRRALGLTKRSGRAGAAVAAGTHTRK